VKGIIFKLVEGCVSEAHGEQVWDELLTEAGLDGVYTTLGNYPDQDLPRLISAGAERLDVPPADLTRWLGHHALQGLAARHPEFFTPHAATLPFLLTLDEVIHAEVRKLDPLADPPVFEFGEDHGRALVVRYTSRRQLCALAEGMIGAAAEHYGEAVTIVHDRCMLDGADSCLMRCTFTAREADELAGVD
jgi:hypothetical protein